jgi:hypothetical protein
LKTFITYSLIYNVGSTLCDIHEYFTTFSDEKYQAQGSNIVRGEEGSGNTFRYDRTTCDNSFIFIDITMLFE